MLGVRIGSGLRIQAVVALREGEHGSGIDAVRARVVGPRGDDASVTGGRPAQDLPGAGVRIIGCIETDPELAGVRLVSLLGGLERGGGVVDLDVARSRPWPPWPGRWKRPGKTRWWRRRRPSGLAASYGAGLGQNGAFRSASNTNDFTGRMTRMGRPAYGDLVPPVQATVRRDPTSPTRCGAVQYWGCTSRIRPSAGGQPANRSRLNRPMSWRVVPSMARSAITSPTRLQNL